ncbi:MAG: rhodanese-like domain-containing protein [Actinomycetota bacterium]
MGKTERRVRTSWDQRKWRSLALLVAGLGITAAFVALGQSDDPGAYTDIDSDRLASMLEQDDITLVNVHVPYEGEIPDTDAFVPYNDVASSMAALPSDKQAPIVLYCRTGRMSIEAANYLAEQGYTNLFNLDGGFVQWQADGYQVI